MGDLILPVLFWLTAVLIVVSVITEFRTASPPARHDVHEIIPSSQNTERSG